MVHIANVNIIFLPDFNSYKLSVEYESSSQLQISCHGDQFPKFVNHLIIIVIFVVIKGQSVKLIPARIGTTTIIH